MWNWDNKVVKLKKRSIQTYFDRKCNTQFGGKDFYKPVKPFLSDKGTGSSGSNIILREDDVLITDPIHVADVFNTYYASIAEYNYNPQQDLFCLRIYFSGYFPWNIFKVYQ